MVDLGKKLKSFQRRIHDINYINTNLIDGYPETEEKYRKARDLIQIYIGNIESLKNYEHGGTFLKGIISGLNAISKQLKDGMISTDSIYVTNSIALESLSRKIDDPVIKRCSEAHKEIAQAKDEFNDRLEELEVKLKKEFERSFGIDEARVEVKNVRYDLERLKGDGKNESQEVKMLGDKYEKIMKETFEKMNDFIGKSGIALLVGEISKEEGVFYSKAAEAMAKVNKS